MNLIFLFNSYFLRRRSSSRVANFHFHHLFSSATFQVDLSHPMYMVWGSNTDVGKTLVSTGIAASVVSSTVPSKFTYIKPIQTGFPRDSDSHFVYRKVSDVFHCRKPHVGLLSSNHVIKASIPAASEMPGSEIRNEGLEACSCGWRDLNQYEARQIQFGDGDSVVSELVCKTLYGWKEAISPHLAAQIEGAGVEDHLLVESLKKLLMGRGDNGQESVWTVIETAGGVASPGPSGTLQCDVYRPFRLPAILVGDGKLGGISGTVSAFESLKLRGYDVIAIVLEDRGLQNDLALLSYLREGVNVFVMPKIPSDPLDDLKDWFDNSRDVFNSLQETMFAAYLGRIKRLHNMKKRSVDIFWWPFTQHSLVPEDSVTVIDSRCGENLAVHKVQNNHNLGLICHQFDACASWWTQGPDATLQIELARDMGYAAGRYGHVMFPENVYEPALQCAECLLGGVGRGWASRTYFSDNGSTAVEIALKMAFRKFSVDHGILSDLTKSNSAEKCIDFKVLALSGSYHGDTLGAMEAQAPSSYTGFFQQPWYSGRGLFLRPPTVFMCNGYWTLSLPEEIQSETLKPEELTFTSRTELFCQNRDKSGLAISYLSYISRQLLLVAESKDCCHIAALVIEPVVQGAGGMHIIDPLFQRVLVRECQNNRIPVIFDEVFTGFWRLGAESAAELLHCSPDIACFGKLMTGGIIPLAATLATEPVFNAFRGDSKLMALLHGHSYTAHAMGCTAASRAIKWFKDTQTNLNIIPEAMQLRELWDNELVIRISNHPAVLRVIALGTLFALELKAEASESGYASLYAMSLVRRLREDGIYTRPLGNVIYLMCGPCTSPELCNQLLSKIYRGIDEFNQDPGKKSHSKGK